MSTAFNIASAPPARLGLVQADEQVTNDRIGQLQAPIERLRGVGAELELGDGVEAIAEVPNRVRQSAASPGLDLDDLAATGRDQRRHALRRRRDSLVVE